MAQGIAKRRMASGKWRKGIGKSATVQIARISQKYISAPSLASRGPLWHTPPMAIFHLRHASVGRSTHAAGTAGAHAAYITRSGACREIVGKDMPLPAAGERGGEARRWLDEQEAGDRKNARVIDKVTIALPRELDVMQRVELVRTFAAEVTQGRVPWMAAIHDQGKDTDNPHAHVILRDRDLETGKMALRMSQSGSTEMLRETWERVCNAALERAGVEARIDRRTLEAQGIDREPTKHEGPIPRQIEAKGRESWKLEAIRDEQATRATERPGERLLLPEATPEPQRGPEAISEAVSLLRAEIERHKRDPLGYEPPAPSNLDQAEMIESYPGEGPWPTINRLTAPAQQILNAGAHVGADLDDARTGYASAREFFPDLADRMHLTAVLAKCGDFLTRVEAWAKNSLAAIAGREPPIQDHRTLWPQNAEDAIRHVEQDLGVFDYEAAGRASAAREQPREALIAEAKELASRDTLSDEQQRRLVEVVDQALGWEAAQKLSAGNADVLRDFGTRDEQLDVAEKYLEAQQAQGADRAAALKAVGCDRELNEMDKQADRDRQSEESRQRNRDNDWEL